MLKAAVFSQKNVYVDYRYIKIKVIWYFILFIVIKIFGISYSYCGSDLYLLVYYLACILAHTSNCHKTEGRIFPNSYSLLPTLVHFRLLKKGVKVTTETIKTSSAIFVCKLCQVGALISCRNFIIAP